MPAGRLPADTGHSRNGATPVLQAGGGGFDSRMLHLAYSYGCM